MKNKIKNLKEFRELRKRYETITLKEIENVFEIYQSGWASKILTGFGYVDTCTLCKNAIQHKCEGCIYKVITGKCCSRGMQFETYMKIRRANTPKELFDAYKARAKYMETLIK